MTEDLTGKTLGPFRIEKRLGQGAMGAVYVGTHQTNGKRAAIKVMTPTNPQSAQKLAARFEREIKLLGKFRHPNIVRFFGASEDRGIRYYAMEYVEGTSLEDILEREKIIPLARAVLYITQICEALQEMHAEGVIHRDLKPANVLVGVDQKVKLTDFGIARDTSAYNETRLTAADHTVGTIAYMSPEQLAGQELTRKSDLYALGILVFRLLTGRLPFSGDTMFDYINQRQSGSFPAATTLNEDLPLEIDALLADLLASDPAARPRDAFVVMQRLTEIAKSNQTARTAPRPRPKTQAILAETVEHRRSMVSTMLNTVFGTKDRASTNKKSKRDRDTPATHSIGESPLFIVAGIVLVAAILAYVFWPMSTDQMYAAASPVMQREDATLDEMLRADRDYLEPILKADPESPHRATIEEFRDRVAVKRAEGKARRQILTGLIDGDATEAEKQYVSAVRLKESDPATADERFLAIARVHADDPAAQPWVTLAKKQAVASREFATDEDRIQAKRKRVEERIIRARAVLDEGKRREAQDQFAAIEEIYGSDEEVADMVSGARPFFYPESPQPPDSSTPQPDEAEEPSSSPDSTPDDSPKDDPTDPVDATMIKDDKE